MWTKCWLDRDFSPWTSKRRKRHCQCDSDFALMPDFCASSLEVIGVGIPSPTSNHHMCFVSPWVVLLPLNKKNDMRRDFVFFFSKSLSEVWIWISCQLHRTMKEPAHVLRQFQLKPLHFFSAEMGFYSGNAQRWNPANSKTRFVTNQM